jgi:hypothetical protein
MPLLFRDVAAMPATSIQQQPFHGPTPNAGIIARDEAGMAAFLLPRSALKCDSRLTELAEAFSVGRRIVLAAGALPEPIAHVDSTTEMGL